MLLKNILIFLTTFFLSLTAFSNHVQNIELNAKHISGNQYKVSLKMWSDCGSGALQSSVIASAACGTTSTNFTLTQEYMVDTIGVNSGCSNYYANTPCTGGGFPNSHYIVYSAIVSLPNCSNLVLSYDICCRSGIIQNIPGTQPIYIDCTLNTSQFPNNSSPEFPMTSQYFVDFMSSVSLDFSAYDQENDSLVYSIVTAKNAANTPTSYNNPHTGTNPIPGTSINAQTGELTMSPVFLISSYLVVIQADEYDRVTGAHKGFVKRETIISTLNNPQFSPTTCTFGGVSNISGGANPVNNYISGCYGAALSFDISYTHATDQAYLWSPVNYQFSGVNYSVNQGGTSIMTVNFPDTISTGIYKFYVQAISDTCNFSIPTYDTFTVEILNALHASNNDTICQGNSTTLLASGGSTYTWTPTTGLSCSNCPNPVANPLNTTTYIVSSPTTNGCPSTDTVTITVDSMRTYHGTINQSNGTALPNTNVYLIAYNSADSTVSKVDSTFTNTNGAYIFSTSLATAWVKATPDSVLFPTELPTYFNGANLFLNSDSLQALACQTSTGNFSTMTGTNPGGPGFISGNVYQGAGKTEAAGDPVSGVDLLLINTQDDVVKHWKTDNLGHLEFSNIAFGDYRVFVDDPKVNNSIAPSIKVDANSASMNYNFSLNSQQLIRTTPNSITESQMNSVMISPNPSSDVIRLKVDKAFTYSITNINGQVIKATKTASTNTEIQVASFPSGIYFIKISTATETTLHKFIKK